MAHIDYYFSTISPYAYLAGTRLHDIAQKHGATLRYKPLDLVALFHRTGGKALPERHPNRLEYRAQELPRQAAKLGMAFNLHPAHVPTNTAPSNYAVIAAQEAGGGDLAQLAFSFGRAAWAEDKDIADDAVITKCLEAAGFDAGLSMSGLLTGAEIYSRNLDEAVAAGAFGAPFYVTDDDARFWGQDRLSDLDAHLAAR